MSAASDDTTSSTTDEQKEKKVVFIRHGCTHMNEYLSSNPFGSPGFTDVFVQDKELYRDSPLSPLGVRQAKSLARRLADSNCPEYGNLLNELDLIVVSPLTRAIQTLEIGLLPHIQPSISDDSKQDRPAVPIVALPHAAERLYLISDVGKPRQKLHEQYGHIVDFHHEGFDEEEWWFRHDNVKKYVEWRPTTQSQKYACPGEPDEWFDSRMIKLYKWLGDRPESTIAVVSHWGVIDWFLDEDFDNCEMRAFPLHEIRQKVERLASR